MASFSPRNGEVILKMENGFQVRTSTSFQSPQWGSNSKVIFHLFALVFFVFQSPQWGSNSKVSCSKKELEEDGVSVPAMGK